VFDSARHYSPFRAGVDTDLTFRLGPIEPVLASVDPLLASAILLAQDESWLCLSPLENRRSGCHCGLHSAYQPVPFTSCNTTLLVA